jgi:hypothetical protein
MNGRIIDESCTGKNLEGSGIGLSEALSQLFIENNN